MMSTRKTNRLKEYDYNQSGYYFITICIQNMKELLGAIVGGGVLDAPQVMLSSFGQLIERQLSAINTHYARIDVQKYIIMPNHIHILMAINNEMTGFSSPANAILPSFISTFKRFVHKECGTKLFQRSYHDYIIRNESDYLRIWNYIDTNPAKWDEDCFNSKNFGASGTPPPTKISNNRKG